MDTSQKIAQQLNNLTIDQWKTDNNFPMKNKINEKRYQLFSDSW